MRIYRFAEFSLLEGGKALEGVRRILREEVEPIVSDLESKLLPAIGASDYKVIGSAGKKADSGDIDFGVMGVDVDEALEERVKEAFPDLDVNLMKGLEVLSVGWPIPKQGGYVQVDIIPIKNEMWSDFVYKFPEGSEYTSSHRNWLMAAITAAMRVSEEKDDDGNVTDYVGHMFRLNDGLYKVAKTYRGKTKLLKSSKKLSEEKITDDPREFVKMLFGSKFRMSDVGTVEQCIDIINGPDFRWKDRLDVIKDYYRKFLERVSLPYPKDL